MKTVYICYNQADGSQRQSDYRDNISRDNVHPPEFILFMIHEYFVGHSCKTARRCEKASELNTRGRARRATNHAGSARANTTSGPAPLLSPPGNRRSLLSGAKRRQWKSQNTPPTGTDATCASPASVLHRDSQPRLNKCIAHRSGVPLALAAPASAKKSRVVRM